MWWHSNIASTLTNSNTPSSSLYLIIPSHRWVSGSEYLSSSGGRYHVQSSSNTERAHQHIGVELGGVEWSRVGYSQHDKCIYIVGCLMSF